MYYESRELYHYGVKGMKWGVRKAEKRKARNEKYRVKEIEYQKKKIQSFKDKEKAYLKSYEEVKKGGIRSLNSQYPNMSDSDKKKAVSIVANRRKQEAEWNAIQAKGYNMYLKKLNNIDTSLSRIQYQMEVIEKGKETVEWINKRGEELDKKYKGKV